jgi:hypothetical protein
MRFSLHNVYPYDVDRLSPKGVYSIGEVGCVKDLIALSRAGKNNNSIAMGFGPPGELLGIAGSYKQWAGSAQLWAIFDDRVDQHPKTLFKTCQLLITYAVQKQELHRVSLTVRSSYTKGNRFAESLGFDFEGKMYGFLPDRDDANLYARLF